MSRAESERHGTRVRFGLVSGLRVSVVNILSFPFVSQIDRPFLTAHFRAATVQQFP